jgi:hypothetical protein
MVVKCEEIWREVSNYLDGDVSPDLRAVSQHVHGCKGCTAVLDRTRNVLLYGDERCSKCRWDSVTGCIPTETTWGNRRSFLGWMVAAAAGAGGRRFEAASRLEVPSGIATCIQARAAGRVPPDWSFWLVRGQAVPRRGMRLSTIKRRSRDDGARGGREGMRLRSVFGKYLR